LESNQEPSRTNPTAQVTNEIAQSGGGLFFIIWALWAIGALGATGMILSVRAFLASFRSAKANRP
jgi:hypothetical protein